MKPLVDFIIIGAQKSGTTSLAAQIASHPDVCFSSIKEPAFFNREPGEARSLLDYHQLFAPTKGQLCGEASTMYTMLPEWIGTAQRIFQYNPRMKLIYLMRHPVERIVSHYAFRYVRGRVTEPPHVAVMHNPQYINRSRYAVQLAPYIELFGRDQLLLLLFEEYVADPSATLRRCAAHLDIDPDRIQLDQHTVQGRTVNNPTLPDNSRRLWHSSATRFARPIAPTIVRRWLRRKLSRTIATKPAFPAELRESLWQLLELDVAEVERLLQRRLAVWREQQ